MSEMAYAFIPEYIPMSAARKDEVIKLLPNMTETERYHVVRAILHNTADAIISSNKDLR